MAWISGKLGQTTLQTFPDFSSLDADKPFVADLFAWEIEVFYVFGLFWRSYVKTDVNGRFLAIFLFQIQRSGVSRTPGAHLIQVHCTVLGLPLRLLLTWTWGASFVI